MTSHPIRSRAALVVCVIALFVIASAAIAAPLGQDVPPATLDAAVGSLFSGTATAQAAFPVTQTVQAAFQQAVLATAAPAQTATAEAINTLIAEAQAARRAKFEGITATRDGGTGAFILGEETAPITIVEFADFACPSCIAYRPIIDQFIVEYVRSGRARFEYRMLPTAGGQLSAFAGLIAECADQQQPGSFWIAVDVLYDVAEAERYDDQLWQPVVAELDLTIEDLQTCVDAADQVSIDAQYAQLLGVTGTPAIVFYTDDPRNATFITLDGTTYNSGAVPLDVLAAVVEAAEAGTLGMDATAEMESTAEAATMESTPAADMTAEATASS